jgi:ABC-type nitrate/sulfonate/bicarbonate transport system substrate-binding protein
MALWVQPDILRPEQLEGKTVAITRFGSTTDFIGRLMLRKIELEGKVNLRPFGGVVEADVVSAAARPLAVWERNPRDLRPES